MAPDSSGAPSMATHAPTQDLIGEHPSIDALRKLVARVAASKVNTVLIYGETGTGKGLVARMIHQQSARADKEFLDINCAAIPGDLLESELFGFERGAFTGAVGMKQGLIEAANGGTVFLDEIRELDPVMQAKILTLLDTQRFRRVGSVRPTSVDVRFIAATNKILLGEVKAGHFREDLYYRLQVIAVNIPPLRERGDDIFILTERFMEKYNNQYASHMRRLDPEVEAVFRAYAWPGNVRELQNLLERICILEDGDCIRMAHLPQRIPREALARQEDATRAQSVGSTGAVKGARSQAFTSYQSATLQFQRDLIRQALDAAHGNLGRAANRLEMTRHAMRHQMLKLGLVSQDDDDDAAP
ncbi:MAG: sigma-54 dependent transcriptional regulator [Burkholderiaceae bacterium]